MKAYKQINAGCVVPNCVAVSTYYVGTFDQQSAIKMHNVSTEGSVEGGEYFYLIFLYNVKFRIYI